jgi:hypothetical protein
MIKLTNDISGLVNTALADGTPCLVGTVDEQGRPQISPKGSVAVYDEESLCYWERSFRGAFAHIGTNPNVVVYYRNSAHADEIPHPGAAMRFHGTAQIYKEGAERERTWELTVPAEKERDPDRKGVAVLIRLERVEALSGAVIMARD